jgi:hypothetical protein
MLYSQQQRKDLALHLRAIDQKDHNSLPRVIRSKITAAHSLVNTVPILNSHTEEERIATVGKKNHPSPRPLVTYMLYYECLLQLERVTAALTA